MQKFEQSGNQISLKGFEAFDIYLQMKDGQIVSLYNPYSASRQDWFFMSTQMFALIRDYSMQGLTEGYAFHLETLSTSEKTARQHEELQQFLVLFVDVKAKVNAFISNIQSTSRKLSYEYWSTKLLRMLMSMMDSYHKKAIEVQKRDEEMMVQKLDDNAIDDHAKNAIDKNNARALLQLNQKIGMNPDDPSSSLSNSLLSSAEEIIIGVDGTQSSLTFDSTTTVTQMKKLLGEEIHLPSDSQYKDVCFVPMEGTAFAPEFDATSETEHEEIAEEKGKADEKGRVESRKTAARLLDFPNNQAPLMHLKGIESEINLARRILRIYNSRAVSTKQKGIFYKKANDLYNKYQLRSFGTPNHRYGYYEFIATKNNQDIGDVYAQIGDVHFDYLAM